MALLLQLTHSALHNDFGIKREHWIAWFAIAFVFLIGLLGLLGISLDIPILYNWDSRGMALNYGTGFALMALSIAFALQQPTILRQKLNMKVIAAILFTGVLIFGIFEINAYIWAIPSMTLQEFLVPTSPVEGHISFYSALGFVLASVASLLLYYLNSQNTIRQGIVWLIQIIGIILITLSFFGFCENMGPNPIFRFLMARPTALGLFFYSVALLFYPAAELHLRLPFFSSGTTRFYTFLVCILWLNMIFWQADWSNAILGKYNFAVDPVHKLVVIEELFEILLSAIILGLGLHILSGMAQLTSMKNALLKTNQQLETALDSISMLSSTLSHDLKTPIKIQMNIIELLKKEQYGHTISSPAVQEMLSALLDSKQFEHELVLNLVDLLRYKMQEERFVPKSFKIEKLLTDIRQELIPLALRKEQTLIVHSDPINEKSIIADYFGLKRVLHNLINNAIQHLNSGCQIDVWVKEQAEEFEFSVKDNGPGIPSELQENLFNRFNRVSSSGLGLYITKQIVNRHGGKIWVESQPGEGSLFCFTLPQH